MEFIEIIKKQEAQSRLCLTDGERAAAVAFFKEREREKKALDAVNPTKTEKNTTSEVSCAATHDALREDRITAFSDPKTLIDQAPDTDGNLVRVPRAL